MYRSQGVWHTAWTGTTMPAAQQRRTNCPRERPSSPGDRWVSRAWEVSRTSLSTGKAARPPGNGKTAPMSDYPTSWDPYQPPQAELVPVSPGKMPTGLKAICIIAIILGALGTLVSCGGIASLVVNESLSAGFGQFGLPQQPDADKEAEQFQEKLQGEIAAIAEKYRPVYHRHGDPAPGRRIAVVGRWFLDAETDPHGPLAPLGGVCRGHSVRTGPGGVERRDPDAECAGGREGDGRACCSGVARVRCRRGSGS